VDREDTQGMLKELKKLETDLQENQSSILVHVEGRRAYQANQPIEKLSSILIDLSLKAGVPIIPVRIRGGLPLVSKGEKFDFPIGYCKQSFWIGKAIWPETLMKLPLAERGDIIKDAINRLGGQNNEFPNPPDPDFAQKIKNWCDYTGCEEAAGAVFQALLKYLGPPPLKVDQDVQEVEDLLESLLLAGMLGQKLRKPAALVLPDSPEGHWMKKLGQWVFGTQGPKVFIGKIPQGDFSSIVKAGVVRSTV
ncbi:MAG: hypothetical protein R3257_00445, partial [bacterium]|nr:hypothetical protein [bacterium]